MSFNIISNLIIVFCAVGILVLFLRRIPEVVDEKGVLRVNGIAMHGVESSAVVFEPTQKFSQKFLELFKNTFAEIGRKVWHFMLDAKDMKEGRILASNFTKIVSYNTRKVVNVGAFSQLRKAEREVAQGDLDKAEETYFQIIKKHPHEYPAYEGLIRIYTKQKKNTELIETLEYLISHNPKNDSYHAQLGRVFLMNRRFAEAAEAYEKALEINHLIPARYANAGLAYQAQGNIPKAKKCYQKALDLEPGNMQYLTMLVDAMVRLDQRSEAKARLEKALEQNPENTQVKEKLAQIARHNGKA